MRAKRTRPTAWRYAWGVAGWMALFGGAGAGWAEPPAVRPVGDTFTAPMGNPCGVPSTAIAHLRHDVAVGVWVEGGEVLARFFRLDGTALADPFAVAAEPAAPDTVASVTSDGRGGFAVLWLEAGTLRRLARVFDAAGQPRSTPFVAWPDPATLDVALAGDGSLAVLVHGATLQVRWFDALGAPLGPAATVDAPEATADERWELHPAPPRLDAAGGLVATWERRRSLREPLLDLFFARDSQIRSATVGRDGQVGPLRVLASAPHLLVEVRTGGGDGAPLWASWVDDGSSDDRLLRLDPQGAPLGEPVALDAGVGLFAALAHLTVEPGGAALAVYQMFVGDRSDLAVQAFAPDGSPLRSGLALGLEVRPDFPSDPVLLSAPGGVWTVLWQNALPSVVSPPPPCAVQPPVFARRFAPGCLASDRRLCLAGERFAAATDWHAPQHGTAGPAGTRALTADTGAFWFFHEDNLELLLKVLDARPIDGGFWVFFGSLSNVGYRVEVTDTETLEQRVYENPPGTFASRGDTAAFPVADGTTAPAAPASAGSPVLDRGAFVEVSGPATPRITPPLCFADERTLCLLERFAVQVDWLDPRSGDSGHGRAVPATGDSGFFWFFDEANLELAVKVLDGRETNGHFWVFFGSLTDVEFRLTVTDRATGAVVHYDNPGFSMASRGDTAAFPE